MCGGPRWKRDEVPDHKFDFIDTRDFTDFGCWMRVRYIFLYLVVLKSFLVYVFDIFTAITMLTTEDWSNHIFNSCPASDGCIVIPFSVGRWLFFGSIIVGFLLLAYEARKSKKIIASRDISYAFTNIMANNYYSLRSYDHFCFFCKINNSTKRQDDFAFFVFFTFKSWKRLLLSDGPRQVINALTLYSFVQSQAKKPFSISNYTGGHLVTGALLISTGTTVLIFACSAALLAAAAVCYIPLLCYIRGNLKEYCCHKVDKRIEEIVKRKKKERIAQQAKYARKEAMGDFSHLKNKNGVVNGLPQPTLPNVSLDDDELDAPSVRSGLTGRSNTTRVPRYNNYVPDYPPAAPGGGYPSQYQQYGYAQSVVTVTTGEDSVANGGYDEDYNASSTNVPLARAAAPMGMSAAPALPQSQYLSRPPPPDGPPSPGYPLSNPYKNNAHQSVSDYGDEKYASPVDTYPGPGDMDIAHVGYNYGQQHQQQPYGHAQQRSQEYNAPANGGYGTGYAYEPQVNRPPSAEQNPTKRVSAASGLAYDDPEDAYAPDANPNHYVHQQQHQQQAPPYQQSYGRQPSAPRDDDRWRRAQR